LSHAARLSAQAGDRSLIELRDLRVSFDGAPALHGIDMTVAKGESVGMVGESGCGKSVTWLAALGLLPAKATVTGQAILDGSNLIGAPGSVARSPRP
jgi:peptide/nickel transport system ATP-binding protein